MKINTWLLLWLALGGYYVVATIGGGLWYAPLTLFCGYMGVTGLFVYSTTCPVHAKREAGE